MGDIRQVEQWYRMGKSKNLGEWMDAMKMQSIASLNCGYADREGNILYLYNVKFPKRAEGYNWKSIPAGQYIGDVVHRVLRRGCMSAGAEPQLRVCLQLEQHAVPRDSAWKRMRR